MYPSASRRTTRRRQGHTADLTQKIAPFFGDFAHSYRICALGEATFGAGYYQYSIVTDDSGFSLYVLARDVEGFFANYDNEVTALLEDFGYTGFLWGVSQNTQTDCPSDIYSPTWDPSKI